MLRAPMAERPHPSPVPRRHLAFALGVICFANFLNYLDRQLVSALEQRDPRALHAVEGRVRRAVVRLHHRLHGLRPARRLGRRPLAPHRHVRDLRARLVARDDRHRPRRQQAALYISRFLIGVGEAGCLVIGPTLIVDLVSAARARPRPLALLPRHAARRHRRLPLGGASATYLGGWRNAFFLGGAPGLLVAGLLLLSASPPAPPRRARTRRPRDYRPAAQQPTLMLIIFAQAFAVMILVPLLHFGIGFFEQDRGMTKMQASTALGVIGLIGGVLGMLLAGVLGDRLARRTRGAYALLAGCAYALALPALLVGFTQTTTPPSSSPC
jgi:MFS family permease